MTKRIKPLKRISRIIERGLMYSSAIPNDDPIRDHNLGWIEEVITTNLSALKRTKVAKK